VGNFEDQKPEIAEEIQRRIHCNIVICVLRVTLAKLLKKVAKP
jgi:hypothetical protein